MSANVLAERLYHQISGTQYIKYLVKVMSFCSSYLTRYILLLFVSSQRDIEDQAPRYHGGMCA
jgi:hypothetical protein